MSSYIPQAAKTVMQDQFNTLHDTFARPITVYRTAQEIVISTSETNNVFYPDAPTNDQTNTVINSGVFQARIKYNPKQDLAFLGGNTRDGNDQITLKTMEGVVRLKLDPTGAAYLNGAKNVRFDNAIYEIFSSDRPHGLFTPNFETFYLKKIN